MRTPKEWLDDWKFEYEKYKMLDHHPEDLEFRFKLLVDRVQSDSIDRCAQVAMEYPPTKFSCGKHYSSKCHCPQIISDMLRELKRGKA